MVEKEETSTRPGLGPRGIPLFHRPLKTLTLEAAAGAELALRCPVLPDVLSSCPVAAAKVVVILGAALDETDHPDALLDLGLAVGEAASGASLVAHWLDAAGATRRLLARVTALRHKREEISEAQGESVLNSALCAQLLIRYCGEPKLMHLFRSTPPGVIE